MSILNREPTLKEFYIIKKKIKETKEAEQQPTAVEVQVITAPSNNTIQLRVNNEEAYNKNIGEYANLFKEDPILDVQNAMEVREQLIAEAQQHIREARGQRALAREKCALAQESYSNFHNRKITKRGLTQTLVVDYGMNRAVPHCGSNQPGDEYYISPLRVYNLGIVNCKIKGGCLHLYPYHERLWQ